jgi:acetyl esterase/lipase
MKRILSLPVFLLAGGAFAQEGEPATPPVPPTFAEVAYGPHERNVLDVWKADAETPTPVVFFIHGGAWNTSDKSRVASAIEMDELLAAGISIVAINYRYLTQAQAEGIDPPVKGPLTDAARALQFVRWKAPEWGFDKLRVAAVGGSAGGCSSLWLALHDDMADPGSADPVARESTRLFCAAVLVPQTSLDPAEMREWIPNINYGAHAFGLRTPGKSLDESFQDFYEARERLLPHIRE